ncbi:hypothetical protein DKT75_21640 [Leucothrix arctica]|uniref:LysM domain-containing protein n=1 Tax=Leucothrix arctica TaxID=1481894 RepID=A0A317C2Y9_9GAMM|nr:hypothetical protein DKT75_21640 [Leucothrix arctica]
MDTLKRVILLAAASCSLLGTANADESLSLESRLKEFNQPAVVIERVISSKPKAKKVSNHTPTSKRRRLTGPCYEYSAETLRSKADAYQPHIRTNSAKYGVDEALIIAVITAESCFRQTARSPKSAQGLMQLIPATAARFGVSDPYQPSQNIRGGTRYLKFLLKRFSGKMEHAIAGYNAGEGAVDRYSGIPPYRETKEYVRRVLSVYHRLKGSSAAVRYAHKSPTTKAKAIYAVQRKTPVRGNFIKPDYKWRSRAATKAAVAAHERQQRRLIAQRTNSYTCRDSSSSKIRRSSDLIKRTKLWRRFYTVRKGVPLSTISKQTGVGLKHLLSLNRGISRLNVKVGRKVLVWQCVNR